MSLSCSDTKFASVFAGAILSLKPSVKKLFQFRSQMSITLKAMTGDGGKWMMILMLPFLFQAYGCELVPIIVEGAVIAMREPGSSSMSIEIKRHVEMHETEVPLPLVIKGKSIYIVQNENPHNPVLEQYVVAKFEKAFQAQGALIVENSPEADFLLQPDLGPNHDAGIPKGEMPIRSNVTFTRLVEFNFYKQGQEVFPVASGRIYSTGSSNDLGWVAGYLGKTLALAFGLKETTKLKNYNDRAGNLLTDWGQNGAQPESEKIIEWGIRFPGRLQPKTLTIPFPAFHGIVLLDSTRCNTRMAKVLT